MEFLYKITYQKETKKGLKEYKWNNPCLRFSLLFQKLALNQDDKSSAEFYFAIINKTK